MIRSLLAARPLTLAVALVALVFVIDLSLPLGVASAVPYTFAVLLALSAKPAWAGPAVAVVCGVLTLVKLEIVPERGTTEMWKVIVNRCLALFAIGMTTLLGILRRRAEERARQHQSDLAHLSRFTLLGQVAAGIAHELNQPLAAVCLQADLAAHLAETAPVKPELTAILTEIAEQSRRAAEIVKSIRRLARRADPGHDPINLNDVASDVVRLFEWQAERAGVVVRLELAPFPGITHGDRIQIEQVLCNLLQNAIESVKDLRSGPRTVTISTLDDDGLTVSVRDTGMGLTDPGRVFERFYTTKPDGMGLGLAISRAIVEAHGGRIWAAPATGGGAEFSFNLPPSSGDGK